MSKITLLIGLLLLSVSVSSQDVDSLFSLYSESDKVNRIKLANEIALTVYELEYTDSLYHINNELDVRHQRAIVNNLMGDYSRYKYSDYAQSALFYLVAADLYEQVNDLLFADTMYGAAAINYHYLGNYGKAVELLMKCYEFEKEIDDKESLSSTLNSLGVVHSHWGENEVALRFFREALEVERTLNRPLNYSNRLASLAKETLLLGDAKEALTLIEEALTIDDTLDEKLKGDRMAVHLNIKGDIYYDMDSLTQSETSFRDGLQFFEAKGNQRMVIVSLLSLGRLYLKGKKYNEASEVLNRCIVLSDQYNIRRSKHDAYRFLYQVHKENNQPITALSNLEHYMLLNDSLFKESSQKQINEFQVKYETQEKELEIIRQQSEIDRHKTKQHIYIGGLIVAGILLIFLFIIVQLRNKRNHALAETNATKDKFFSIISHDLKNPAISLRDALQQLINHGDKWDSDSLSLYYEELLKSANGQVELLYNLLNWAQVQTGRMPYNPTQLDLTAELRPDIALIKNITDSKGITLDIRMPDSAIVTGDRNMLTTVVRNLLTNAVKFTDKGGRVTLEIKPEGKEGYTVSVADTGIGMSREQMETFFRIDSQRSLIGTAGEQGSGLGLVVCKELIEKHGSSLHVESEIGKGSLFRFKVRGCSSLNNPS